MRLPRKSIPRLHSSPHAHDELIRRHNPLAQQMSASLRLHLILNMQTRHTRTGGSGARGSARTERTEAASTTSA